MRYWMMLVLLATAATALRAQPQQCDAGMQTQNEPRNPEIQCLPEFGRWRPTLDCGENLGQQIVPLGDIDGDSLADWAVAHTLCTIRDYAPYLPVEVRIYHGKRGGLPEQSSGVRLGPTELTSATSIVTAGDWDGDSHTDLCCRLQRYGDTSVGNTTGYEIAELVIFWGQPNGLYSINDTSRLSSGADRWLGVRGGVSTDLDHDRTNDLAIMTGGYGFSAGQRVMIPRLQIYRGHRGGRWGRNGLARSADWRWWNTPEMNSLSALDHDGDGATDLVLAYNEGPIELSVLYGSTLGALPDTTAVESADIKSVGAQTSIFSDLTGDGVPELITTNGELYTMRVYLGKRGQRLSQQFGSEQPHPGQPQWWGKPWAEVWKPARIAGWPGPYDRLYNIGDIDRDGIEELVSYESPWVTIYRGGDLLDSLIDAMIDLRAAGGEVSTERPRAVANLGDIDGSGRSTIAVGVNGVLFVKGVKLSETGIYREVPKGLGPEGRVADVEPREDQHTTLQAWAEPNPAGSEVRVRWRAEGAISMSIIDADGRVVDSAVVYDGAYRWECATAPRGTYFLTLTAGTQRTTIPIVLR